MRVLMTADTIGGVWTYAMDLCAALSHGGCATTLVTMGRAMSADQRTAAKRIQGLEIVETTFQLEWMADPWDDVSAAGELLLDTALRVRPDVVHLNGFAHGALPWSMLGFPVVVVAHSCVETWWRAVKGVPTGDDWRTYREALRRGIHQADMLVAPTRAMLRATQACHGEHGCARVIHNGRDGSLYRPAAKRPVVLAAGRLWDQAKNVAALQRVACTLDWPVRIAGENQKPVRGDAATPPPVAQPAGRTSPVPAPACTWLGPLTPRQLSREMAAAGIYVLPAKYEPFGLSAVEAGLCGCALVLGDIPTLREVWADAAEYVDPDDPPMLQDTVNALIADDARRRRLAEAARRRAQRYTPVRMAAGYLAAYRELIRQPETSIQGATA